MGLGGNLIWTGVFQAIHEQHGIVAVACDTPMLSDLLRGYLWRRDRDYREDLIFKGNPVIGHVSRKAKLKLERWIDKAFEKLISPDFVRRRYENLVFEKSLELWKLGYDVLHVHVDMRIHSYAASQDSKRTYWKKGGCAAHVMAKPFGVSVPLPSCHFYPSVQEDEIVRRLLDDRDIYGPYIVVEPDTNQDWFGGLRAWPLERWQQLVSQIQEQYPHLTIIQTGLGRCGVLKGVHDFTDSMDFRSVGSLLHHSTLYIGTEGGLMHLAAAMKTPSIILWGGVTLPEFAGYPHLHSIICHYVRCAPCGNAGWCNNGHICMEKILVTEVLSEIERYVR